MKGQGRSVPVLLDLSSQMCGGALMRILLGLLFFGVHGSEERSVQIHPASVVVRHGGPAAVNCTVSGNPDGIGWEASEGSVRMVPNVTFVTWSLESLKDWDIRPQCFAIFTTGPDSGFQCGEKLNITVYKTSDSVSISVVNHTGPMLEWEQYQLQCKVQNIAPVQYLTVKWYKGETLENQTSYNALTKTPVNVSSTLLITPTSTDDGAQYSCVAELELGPEGPQPPPSNKSDPLSITVNYAPIFYSFTNETLEVAEGQVVALNCSALGKPLPEYSWSSPHNEEENTRETLITSTSLPPGTHVYTCNAKNYLGESRKYFTVEVIVIDPPSEIFELESDAVDLGASVVLKCSSQGNPQPRYNWTYPWAANVQENSVDGVSWLHISNASEENNGSYTCYAQNRIGHVNKTVSLIVRGKNTTTTVSECQLKMEPSTVVVRFGDPVSVNCTVSGVHEGIGWEAAEGSVEMVTDPKVKFLTWSLENLTYWDIRPQCYAIFEACSQLSEKLNITVYKPPDSVSISAVNHTGPMLEGEQYQLQCEVQNIAPVQNLTVKWYKGETLESQTSYDALTKTLVNVSSTLLITPTSADDGAQYSCVAELELGPEGPKPPPEVKSDPFNIIVHYAPIFYNFTNETLEVAEGQEVTLNCSAVGNPLPEYSWSPPHNEETLITSTSLPLGTHVYTCNAKNDLGENRKYFTVKVIVIVDYLPLIAGIVALAVVCISIAFVFIYLIYYKNTKMGEYNLKLGKSRTQNAHVAQNGRDSSLPMKKLTKPSLPV